MATTNSINILLFILLFFCQLIIIGAKKQNVKNYTVESLATNSQKMYEQLKSQNMESIYVFENERNDSVGTKNSWIWPKQPIDLIKNDFFISFEIRANGNMGEGREEIGEPHSGWKDREGIWISLLSSNKRNPIPIKWGSMQWEDQRALDIRVRYFADEIKKFKNVGLGHPPIFSMDHPEWELTHLFDFQVSRQRLTFQWDTLTVQQNRIALPDSDSYRFFADHKIIGVQIDYPVHQKYYNISIDNLLISTDSRINRKFHESTWKKKFEWEKIAWKNKPWVADFLQEYVLPPFLFFLVIPGFLWFYPMEFKNPETEKKKELYSLFSIPIKTWWYVFGLFPPWSSTFLTLFLSMYLHMENVTQTHCKGIINFIPTISAAVGNNTPERYIWRLGVAFMLTQRLGDGFFHFQMFKKELGNSKFLYFVNRLSLASHILQNFSLFGLTFVSSIENFEVHEKCFMFFMIFQSLQMVSHLYLFRKARYPFKSYQDKKAWRWDLSFFLLNHLFFGLALTFYVIHNTECRHYLYSLFGLFEWLTVWTNILFQTGIFFELPADNMVIYVGQNPTQNKTKET